MDLIDRQAAIDVVKEELTAREHSQLFNIWTTAEVRFFVVEAILKQIPTAKPKTGRWIKMSDSYGTYHCCSRCGREGTRMWKYCPHCGTKMEVNMEE